MGLDFNVSVFSGGGVSTYEVRRGTVETKREIFEYLGPVVPAANSNPKHLRYKSYILYIQI